MGRELGSDGRMRGDLRSDWMGASSVTRTLLELPILTRDSTNLVGKCRYLSRHCRMVKLAKGLGGLILDRFSMVGLDLSLRMTGS